MIAGAVKGAGKVAQMGAKALKAGVKTAAEAGKQAVEAGSDVVRNAKETIDQNQNVSQSGSPSLSEDLKDKKQMQTQQDILDQLNKTLDDFLMNKEFMGSTINWYNKQKEKYDKYNKEHKGPLKSFIESTPETMGAKTLSGILQFGRGAVRLGSAGKKAIKGNKTKKDTKLPEVSAQEKGVESSKPAETVINEENAIKTTIPEVPNMVPQDNASIKIGTHDKVKTVKPKTMVPGNTNSTAEFSFKV